MINKIDKFRGKLELNIKEETIVLDSLKVNDLFDLLLLNKQDNQFEYGCNLLVRVFSKLYPDDIIGLTGWVIANYSELMEELMIALGWTTKDKIKELKNKKEDKKDRETKKDSWGMFKARLAAEADIETIEDKYITTSYVLMREFKYTRDEILNMDATVFLILIDEMNKQAQKEKEEMDKNKSRKH
jgi:hypothetical protein